MHIWLSVSTDQVKEKCIKMIINESIVSVLFF